ncbi:MAG: hypothetical protein GTO22_20865 [Gemmatimonadales bacterium]|nr:hypothetical protein [Gemmatimonadales bacterium]
MRALRPLIAMTTVAAVGVCGGGEREDQPITVADVGFRTPESVLHDPAADVYLVTNINGDPLEKDGNGFISRLAPDGSVLALRWIDGTQEGITLNAPKGMGISGDTLFVADIDAVRLFDRTSGAPLGSREITGATFLNDVAVGPDGTVYVTDSGFGANFEPSGTDALYKFEADGQATAVAQGESLGHPNGISAKTAWIVLVTSGTGRVFLVESTSGMAEPLPQPPKGQLDGVCQLDDGSLLLSSWEGQAVFRMQGGQYSVVVDSVEAPADIGYDAQRNRVLIPLFMADRVEIVPLGD